MGNYADGIMQIVGNYAVADTEEAIALVAAHLPADIGPAVAGTANDLKREGVAETDGC